MYCNKIIWDLRYTNISIRALNATQLVWVHPTNLRCCGRGRHAPGFSNKTKVARGEGDILGIVEPQEAYVLEGA